MYLAPAFLSSERPGAAPVLMGRRTICKLRVSLLILCLSLLAYLLPDLVYRGLILPDGTICLEIFRRQEIKLVSRVNSLPLQPVVQSHEVVSCVFKFFLVLRGGVNDLDVVFDLNDINGIAFFNEKVRAELPPLRVFAFLPGIFNRVEPLRRVLEPCVNGLSIFPSNILLTRPLDLDYAAEKGGK